MQRVIHLPDPPSSENSDGNEEAESGTSPPDAEESSSQAPNYSVHPNSTIAPPDYQDALQDVLVVRGDDDPNQPPTYASVSLLLMIIMAQLDYTCYMYVTDAQLH